MLNIMLAAASPKILASSCTTPNCVKKHDQPDRVATFIGVAGIISCQSEGSCASSGYKHNPYYQLNRLVESLPEASVFSSLVRIPFIPSSQLIVCKVSPS
ncbi:hypothetical protein Q3G72_009526 [Acer saccharum]|nr:hypothetical protein Q3G72_009526 [Acer saccharum]